MHSWFICVIALGSLLMSCGREEPGRVVALQQVSVIVSQVSSEADAMVFPARVASAREVELATRASGIVRQVRVDVGDPVRTGELLVAIESGDVGASVTAAEAEARLARRYYDRIESLERDGAATSQELDEARAGLAAADARLQNAKTQLSYVRLTAPVSAVVTERHVDPGDLVVPGQVALALSAPDDVKIVADLPAAAAGRVVLGDFATVANVDSKNRWAVTITSVVPVLEKTTRRFRVQAEFKGDIDPPPPGSYVRLEVADAETKTVWIPTDAVVSRGQLRGVFTVENDTLRLRWVRLGRARADAVELLAGLDTETLVVRRPVANLADGTAVEAVETEPWSPVSGAPIPNDPASDSAGMKR